MLIAQLSDPHLRARGQLYQGLVDSNAMFAAAVAQLNALRPEPDLVLLTGDVVDTGSAADYAAATALLAPIRRPLLAIPGNHDDRNGLRACLGRLGCLGTASFPASSTGPMHVAAGDLGPVRVLGLDVTVPGAHHGEADAEACRWLAERLAEEPGRPTVVAMHQPPFRTGIPFIDRFRCRGGRRLRAVLERAAPHVERVLCGHVHRFVQLRFAGTLLVTAPSTTTAIALRLEEDAVPASFVEPPAMLLHQWRPGTGLVTHHVPIGTFPGPLPFF